MKNEAHLLNYSTALLALSCYPPPPLLCVSLSSSVSPLYLPFRLACSQASSPYPSISRLTAIRHWPRSPLASSRPSHNYFPRSAASGQRHPPQVFRAEITHGGLFPARPAALAPLSPTAEALLALTTLQTGTENRLFEWMKTEDSTNETVLTNT